MTIDWWLHLDALLRDAIRAPEAKGSGKWNLIRACVTAQLIAQQLADDAVETTCDLS